ncbi:hypothetical protein HBH92_198380 [Parastagonospora nodorum]|nr:hypothetical protein HBH92_198380 [Parastagonospora nodorum]KAH4421375.1 hypothetical protein HBH93_201360 [Parastagonospora nodorum]KAH4434189.1 hypothetical protein HBH91_210990 [Parastagonospora nodorum]KAH4499962.1 hypothetical protein HBH89_121150 [Parastagonospora nodorum]KAH4528781.1 hypothetical protein HBH85_202910 [Parastagonospora nodorum]
MATTWIYVPDFGSGIPCHLHIAQATFTSFGIVRNAQISSRSHLAALTRSTIKSRKNTKHAAWQRLRTSYRAYIPLIHVGRSKLPKPKDVMRLDHCFDASLLSTADGNEDWVYSQ